MRHLSIRRFLVLLSIAAALPSWGGSITTLEYLNSFTGTGAGPTVRLSADTAGNMYGTTDFGGGGATGSNGNGTVFKIDAGTHAFSTLLVLNSASVGRIASAPVLADAAGNLYGMAEALGPGGHGSIFEIAANTHATSVLATFNGANGDAPTGGLIADAAGNMYGTTFFGSPNGHGSVFKMAAGSHAITTLATFSNPNGTFPVGGLVADAAGNLYGETDQGGPGAFGTVFKVAAGTSVLTTIATFNNVNGGHPSGGLIMDAAGNLYGTTSQGGLTNSGTVFEILAGTTAPITLATFNGSNGASPRGGVIMDAAGNLYGTTYFGGANNYGTVFRIDAITHAITVVASFNNANGANPYAGLLAGADGNLYGTTQFGGVNNPSTSFGDGTVFEVTGSGFVAPAVPLPSTFVAGLITFAALATRRLPHFIQRWSAGPITGRYR